MQIEKHTFENQVSDVFKRWMLASDMWESSHKRSRFQRIWTEDMKFPGGVDIWVARELDQPIGIIVHEKKCNELPFLHVEYKRGRIKQITEFEEVFHDLGRVGMYVAPERRREGIAVNILQALEHSLQNENPTVRFPLLQGSSTAYSILSKHGQWVYPMEYLEHSLSRKFELSRLAQDLHWMNKNPSYQAEGGIYFNTKWRTGFNLSSPFRQTVYNSF